MRKLFQRLLLTPLFMWVTDKLLKMEQWFLAKVKLNMWVPKIKYFIKLQPLLMPKENMFIRVLFA